MNDIQFNEEAWKRLTPREIEIIKAAADGNSIKGTASLLKIANGTVQTHRRTIIGKLNCGNMTNAVTILLRGKVIA